MKIEWDESFSVGVELFDEHHKKLLGLLNELDSSIGLGEDKTKLECFLSSFLDYAFYHFALEEHFMKEIGYADYVDHKKEHDRFVSKIHDFHSVLNDGNPHILKGLSEYIHDWFKDHVLEMDKKYTSSFKGKTICFTFS